VSSIFKHITTKISHITHKKPDQFDFINVTDAMNSSNITNAIWGYQLEEAVRLFVSEETEHRLYEPYCHLLRLILFSRYLNDRMAFTVVTAPNEDDAFDMFEALNTTGEPLTAFETFKPKVIDQETLENYEHSPSYEYISKIESYLETFKKAEQKQKATSEMLVPFALAETGDKLQKKLTDQRRYLRDQYDSDDLSSEDDKRLFVQRLSHTAIFLREVWDTAAESRNYSPAELSNGFTLVGMEALRDLKHSITIAPLIRFYGFMLDCPEGRQEELDSRINDFKSAIDATVAFSMLWRGAKGGTDNIDGRYRSVMRDGGKALPPLAQRVKTKSGSTRLGVVSALN